MINFNKGIKVANKFLGSEKKGFVGEKRCNKICSYL